MCVHHLTDERKQALFAEIFDRLVPGGWYLNYDPVAAPDKTIEQAWERVADRFAGIDVYWKKLENVIYGGYRPA